LADSGEIYILREDNWGVIVDLDQFDVPRQRLAGCFHPHLLISGKEYQPGVRMIQDILELCRNKTSSYKKNSN
jgi:hypothetical protein